MLVGPYLSHPLTRYMKNARCYSQKPLSATPATFAMKTLVMQAPIA